MIKFTVTTPPSSEPVSLADAKIHLRTVTGDTSEDAAVITPSIAAAREYCENVTGRALASQTVKAYPDQWGTWTLPRTPIVSITSIKYYDEDDVVHTLDTADYSVDLVDGTIMIDEWPSETLRELNPIVVEYTAGYTALPKTIRQAMLLLIAHWYTNREAVGVPSAEVDYTVKRLLYQYKVWWM